MWKPSLILAAILLVPGLAVAGGSVTKALRPQLRTFDDKGQPTGMLAASEIKVPAPILAMGGGGSVGTRQGGNVVFLRGLAVETSAVNATCALVQNAARASGTAYAATNMGLGGASDCKKPAR